MTNTPTPIFDTTAFLAQTDVWTNATIDLQKYVTRYMFIV